MKKKRKKTLYTCTQTRDILPSCPVGGVHTCSVVSFLSHHLTWWKVRLMKKKSCFIWEKLWSSITFGYKYSSIKWTTHHHRFTVIAIIVALEGWQKGGGGGVDLSYRKSGANMTRKGETGSSGGEWGAGLDHNQANGTLILPSPLCGHRDNVGSRLPGFTVCSSQPLSYSLRHSQCKNNKKKNHQWKC